MCTRKDNLYLTLLYLLYFISIRSYTLFPNPAFISFVPFISSILSEDSLCF